MNARTPPTAKQVFSNIVPIEQKLEPAKECHMREKEQNPGDEGVLGIRVYSSCSDIVKQLCPLPHEVYKENDTGHCDPLTHTPQVEESKQCGAIGTTAEYPTRGGRPRQQRLKFQSHTPAHPAPAREQKPSIDSRKMLQSKLACATLRNLRARA